MENRNHSADSATKGSTTLRAAAGEITKQVENNDTGREGKDASAHAINDSTITPEIAAAQKQGLAQKAAQMEKDGILPRVTCGCDPHGDTGAVGQSGARKAEGALKTAEGAAAAAAAALSDRSPTGGVEAAAAGAEGTPESAAGQAKGQDAGRGIGQAVETAAGKSAAHGGDLSEGKPEGAGCPPTAPERAPDARASASPPPAEGTAHARASAAPPPAEGTAHARASAAPPPAEGTAHARASAAPQATDAPVTPLAPAPTKW